MNDKSQESRQPLSEGGEQPPDFRPRLDKLIKLKSFWTIVLIVVIALFAAVSYGALENWLGGKDARLFLSRYSWLFLGAMALVATFLIVWFVPKYQISSLDGKRWDESQSEFELEKQRIQLRDEMRKTIAQILGGAFFVFGLVVTYQTFQLNREGQVTERFAKAAEMLGAEKPAVKLSGMYALERVAVDSPKDLTTILEILAALVRENTIANRPGLEKIYSEAESQDPQPLSPDLPSHLNVYAVYNNKDCHQPGGSPLSESLVAATIIKRLTARQRLEDFKFDLAEVDLRCANLSDANLANANLRGAALNDAKLINANLEGANIPANLQRVDFTGANLRGANLADADFRAALFTCADLRGAKLKGSEEKNPKGEAKDSSPSFEQLKNAIIDEATTLSAIKLTEAERAALIEQSKKNLESCKQTKP